MTAAAATPVVMILPQDWEARTLALLRQALAERDAQQAVKTIDLPNLQAAARAAGVPVPTDKAEQQKLLARWRGMRFAYPLIDERAAVGKPGRLRRWNTERLDAVMRELAPKMRRRSTGGAP